MANSVYYIGSPCSVARRRLSSSSDVEVSAISHPTIGLGEEIYIISDTESSEVEVLASVFGGVTI